MAQIIITIPDGVLPRVRAAFSKNKTPAIDDEILSELQSMLKRRVLDYESLKIRDKANKDVDNLQF